MVEGMKRMTAKRKLEVCAETGQTDANVGEIPRRYGLLNDPPANRGVGGTGRPDGAQGAPGADPQEDREYAELVAELAQKENALAELTVTYTLLKASERSGWKGPSMASTSRANGGRR